MSRLAIKEFEVIADDIVSLVSAAPTATELATDPHSNIVNPLADNEAFSLNEMPWWQVSSKQVVAQVNRVQPSSQFIEFQ